MSWGIMRCERLSATSFSLHSEGRAIDWHLDARAAPTGARRERLIDRLLATDRAGNPHALARRMGIQEIIWNCRSWWSGAERMEPLLALRRPPRPASARGGLRPWPTATTCTSGCQPGRRAHAHQLLARARALVSPGPMADELSPKNRIPIEVDRGLCIGSGDCVDTAPDVFELDDEDKAVVIDPDGAPTDDVIEAAGNCPVTAIFVSARRATCTRRA